MSEQTKTLIAIDPGALKEINRKLDEVLSMNSRHQEEPETQWMPNKEFMRAVSIKAYNTFAKIREKMPDSLKREVNRKQYIHRDAIRLYFEGMFSD
ncbi:MAG: hypothetical protein NXH89_00640 [Cyclobacteriaceae bacterium]|nr:hypothetical protein [Cyclobacteriaceae bacterium]